MGKLLKIIEHPFSKTIFKTIVILATMFLLFIFLQGCSGKKEDPPKVVAIETNEPVPAPEPAPGNGITTDSPMEELGEVIPVPEAVVEPEPEEAPEPEIQILPFTVVRHWRVDDDDIDDVIEVSLDNTRYLIYKDHMIRK